MIRLSLSFALAALVPLTFIGTSLHAQEPQVQASPATRTTQTLPYTATILQGVITDSSGAAVVGAAVSLGQTSGPLHYDTLSDSTGHYQFPSPAAGLYTLAVKAKGFGLSSSQITLSSGVAVTANLQVGIAGTNESVIVTATTHEVFGEKSGVPLEKFPQAVQVVTKEDFLNMNALSLGDILGAVPSASVGSARESTYQGFAFRIRGFTAYPVYNGVYQRYFFNVDPSALANIEEVQVVKGPSGVLIGQGEVGGVMNITTRRPKHEYGGSVSLVGGAYDEASGSFDVTGPVRSVKGLNFDANGEVERSGSFIQYLPINRTNGAFNGTWEHGDKLAVHFVGEWQERQTFRNPGLPAIGTLLPNGTSRIARSTYLGDPATNGNPGHSNFTATGMLIQAWVPIKLANNWTLTPRVSYSTFTGIYSEINLNKVLADLVTVSRTGRYVEERHDYPIEQVDLSGSAKTFGLRHHLLVGLQNNLFRVGTIQQTMATVPSINTLNPYPTYGTIANGPYPLSNVSLNNYDSWSLYTQDSIDVTERLTLTVGARGDWYLAHRSTAPNYTTHPTILNTNFNHGTYQAGATYRLNGGWSLFGGYATGFNIESTVNVLTFDGVPLNPEASWQGEGGVRFLHGPLSFTGSLFQINKTNAVTGDPNHPGYSVNNGNVRGRGLELETKLQLGKGFFLEPGYTYEYAEIIQSNSGNQGFQVADTPRNRADLFFVYGPRRLPIELRGGLNFVGDRAWLDVANVVEGPNLLGSNVRLPQYTTASLGATYTAGRARLDVNVRNLTDRVYYTRDGGNYGNFDVIPGQPRSVNARLSYRF